MGFIRVRAAAGPRHEFDVAEAEVAATPTIYKVIDADPVSEARPPTYVAVKRGRKPRDTERSPSPEAD